MLWKRLTLNILILTAGVAFTAAFAINWCHLIYQCGCTFYWAGGAEQCNIHTPGVHHCPWCVNPTYGGIAFGFTMVAQTVTAFWPGEAYLKRFLFVLLASPVASAIAGVGIGLHAGYWS